MISVGFCDGLDGGAAATQPRVHGRTRPIHAPGPVHIEHSGVGAASPVVPSRVVRPLFLASPANDDQLSLVVGSPRLDLTTRRSVGRAGLATTSARPRIPLRPARHAVSPAAMSRAPGSPDPAESD